MEPLTFWPPPPEELWRLRLRVIRIAARDELVRVDLTTRRSNRSAIVATVLHALGMARGLTLTLRSGARVFLLTETHALEPLFAWFAAQGYETGELSGEDLA